MSVHRLINNNLSRRTRLTNPPTFMIYMIALADTVFGGPVALALEVRITKLCGKVKESEDGWLASLHCFI